MNTPRNLIAAMAVVRAASACGDTVEGIRYWEEVDKRVSVDGPTRFL